jgi:hypothetical protein
MIARAGSRSGIHGGPRGGDQRFYSVMCRCRLPMIDANCLNLQEKPCGADDDGDHRKQGQQCALRFVAAHAEP